MGAALVAAGLVLSGCGAVGDVTTTSSPPPESPVNPWDLPLEERPALFDPCAEIPVEAIEEGVGSPLERDENLHINRPGEVLSCGWSNREIIFNVLSTWKSQEDFLNDAMFVASNQSISDRAGLRLVDSANVGARSCQHAFFTSTGTVFASVDLVGGLSSFNGAPFADACEVLEEVVTPVLQFFPEGEF